MSERLSFQPARTEGPRTTINTGKQERLWSMLAGVVFAAIALARRDRLSLGIALLGAELAFRGVTGFSLLYKLLNENRALVSQTAAASVPHGQGIRVEKTITINRSVGDVFAFWRDFTNLPRFMEHLQSVDVESELRSHWVAKGPAGISIEWDAEIINEQPDELIAWRTLSSAEVDHAGTVHFKPAPGDRGTEIHVEMEYAPIAGVVGATIAKLFRREPQQQIADDLRHLKQWLEVGEILTVDGQPSGRSG